jgi:hypothetical protein
VIDAAGVESQKVIVLRDDNPPRSPGERQLSAIAGDSQACIVGRRYVDVTKAQCYSKCCCNVFVQMAERRDLGDDLVRAHTLMLMPRDDVEHPDAMSCDPGFPAAGAGGSDDALGGGYSHGLVYEVWGSLLKGNIGRR